MIVISSACLFGEQRDEASSDSRELLEPVSAEINHYQRTWMFLYTA